MQQCMYTAQHSAWEVVSAQRGELLFPVCDAHLFEACPGARGVTIKDHESWSMHLLSEALDLSLSDLNQHLSFYYVSDMDSVLIEEMTIFQ